MAFVVKINGQVLELEAEALSYVGCMIGSNGNGNGNGATHGVANGLLELRKQDPEKCAKFKKWCIKQYGSGISRDVTVQEAHSSWGVVINPGTPYRLYNKEYAE